ncbi:MAG: amidohydrolase family protein, partial [Sciscionella sp.]
VEPLTSESARRLRFPESTLLPGLVNAHVHLSLDAGEDPVASLLDSEAADVAAGTAERAGQLLRCGVTTARDLGDRAAGAVLLRDAVSAGELPGPRILAAVAPLTPPGGHCWFFGGEVDGERAIRDMVRRNAAVGADVIKVMASGGQITQGGANMWESQFDAAQLRVIVEEAARHGLPVAAHAHGTEAIVASVAAGVHTVEHCTWMAGPGQQERREDVALEMAARNIAVCSTSSSNWRMMVERMGEEVASRVYGRLSWMDSLGVPLLTGTDAGLRGSVFDDFVGALELYEWLGFGNDRIVELATVGSARALGLGEETGQLAEGFCADLLVVDGDPLTDLTALRDIRLVLAAGREHTPVAQEG